MTQTVVHEIISIPVFNIALWLMDTFGLDFRYPAPPFPFMNVFPLKISNLSAFIVANRVQNVRSSPSFGGSYVESVTVAWDDAVPFDSLNGSNKFQRQTIFLKSHFTPRGKIKKVSWVTLMTHCDWQTSCVNNWPFLTSFRNPIIFKFGVKRLWGKESFSCKCQDYYFQGTLGVKSKLPKYDTFSKIFFTSAYVEEKMNA